MPNFDDRVTRELHRAARPPAVDIEGVAADVSRRRYRRATHRRAGAVAAALGMLIAVSVGLWAVQSPGETGDIPGSSPSATPSPSLEPSTPGQDLGLGFDVCVFDRLRNVAFQEGIDGTAWTAAPIIKGACADVGYQPQADPMVVVDIDGDGIADAYTEMPCRYGCHPSPFGATDLNGDGRNELIVNVQPFSIMDYMVFVITDDDDLVVATVTGDGHATNGFREGQPTVFSSGGDEGNAESVRCTGWPGPDTQITQTTSYHPVDSPDPTEVGVTSLRLTGTTFMVVSREDLRVPPGQNYTGHSTEPACGLDWYRNL